ncbi:hypothetical protein BJY00DRAFT_327032 [Aspergillus carlsbadensis]|nr:hypothetical protein BJY00DRAFT_327032 [Aspergillus carlsbadensis]
MAETRSGLKRKAIAALVPAPREPSPTSEQIETEHQFVTKYGTDAVRRPYFKELMDGAARLFKQGAIEWVHDLTQLRHFYMELSVLIAGWSMDYLIDDLDFLPEDRIRHVIAALDGFCVQTDWAALRPMLPPTIRENSAHIFGELVLYLTIKERLFENSFWYLDGKRGPSNAGEDPTFAEKLNYLFERFYETNPQYAVLWRMQTQRLANSPSYHYAPNPKFGKANEERHEAALPALADSVLNSEPICWLLKAGLTSAEAEAQRAELIDVFRKAVRTMLCCETWTNGIPVFRGIEELGGVFRGKSEFVSLHPYTYRLRRDLYINQKIIVVARPGLVYVDTMRGSYLQMKPGAVEVVGAEVIPKYVEEATQGTADGGMDVVKDQDGEKDEDAGDETDVTGDEDEGEDDEDDEDTEADGT